MSCIDFRIIDWNFVAQDNVTLTPSSESSEFPVSNLKNFFRSKVWRTTGHFEITALNNKINFNDVSLGPELTATMTVGHYTSSTLAAEIKAQMEAVSAFTFTVTFDSLTGLWNVASSSSFFSLLFETGTDVATSAANAIGFSAEDYLGATAYTGPKISIHTDETLFIDLRTEEEIDSFALVFDPVLKVKFSEEAIIKIQANATNNWAAPAVNITVAMDEINDVLTHFFTTDQAYRYWRVQFIDSRNTYLYLEVPKVILGRKIDINKVPQVGFNIDFEDQSKKISSMFGHEYVDVLPIKKTMGFDFKFFTNDQIEELWKSYFRAGSSRPIYIELDATEELFDKDRMFIYGKYSSKISSKHQVRNLFNQALDIEEAF